MLAIITRTSCDNYSFSFMTELRSFRINRAIGLLVKDLSVGRPTHDGTNAAEKASSRCHWQVAEPRRTVTLRAARVVTKFGKSPCPLRIEMIGQVKFD